MEPFDGTINHKLVIFQQATFDETGEWYKNILWMVAKSMKSCTSWSLLSIQIIQKHHYCGWKKYWRNPAPVGTWQTSHRNPVCTVLNYVTNSYQLVQDFFHPQYLPLGNSGASFWSPSMSVLWKPRPVATLCKNTRIMGWETFVTWGFWQLPLPDINIYFTHGVCMYVYIYSQLRISYCNLSTSI